MVFHILPLVNSSGAVRRRTVKILIAKACTQKDPVMHVDGDDHHFHRQGGDSPFAEQRCAQCVDHFRSCVNVVMNAGPDIGNFPFHAPAVPCP